MERVIVTASESGVVLRDLDSLNELMGAVYGADGLLLTESDLAPEFFDLRSGLAGEALQKFTNYRVRVAIVVPDPGRYGPRVAELAFEHRRHNLIRFVASEAEALEWLRLAT